MKKHNKSLKKHYTRPKVTDLGKIIRVTEGSGANSGTDQSQYAKNNGAFN